MCSVEKRRVYFDHNATTYMRRDVVDSMLPFFRERFGNASSLHFFGQENREALDRAREHVAAFIGAQPGEIVFTSGGTESDNLALRGAVRAKRGQVGTPHIITSLIEHPAVLKTCQSLETEGVEVTYLPVTAEGVVRIDLFERAIRDGTILVSIMLANNETGVIQPIREISRIARQRGVTVHTDAVQAVGKINVDVDELGVDLLSISAHKFYGPKGIGALYVRSTEALEPVYTGGGHEWGFRPGTENIPGIIGFGEACRISRIELPGEIERISRLRDRLERAVLERVDHVTVNGAGAPRVPGTLNVTFSYVEGEAVTLDLSMRGFAVSSGSACASGASEPSAVLLAMGLDPADAQGAVRISLGIENTGEDVDSFLDVLPGIIGRLRKLSPLNK